MPSLFQIQNTNFAAYHEISEKILEKLGDFLHDKKKYMF